MEKTIAEDRKTLSEAKDITTLLREWRAGSKTAEGEFFTRVYPVLHAIARKVAFQGARDKTLQPTAVVNEAYIRLLGQRGTYEDRNHFFAIAAEMMRRVIIDYARARRRVKRGGEISIVGLEAASNEQVSRSWDIIDIDEVLTELLKEHPRPGKVVEWRVFAGMTVAEIAAHLGRDEKTVQRDWNFGKAWLRVRLTKRSSKPQASGQHDG